MKKSWKKQITIKNVRSFFQAYSNRIYNELVGLPEHTQEQIAYRHSLCENDCFLEDKDGDIGCIYCGCDPYTKAFAKTSCNDGERFPDLMNKEEWENYTNNTQAKKKQ